MIEFRLAGKPVSKERPRKGRNGHFYTPKKTRAWEALVGYTGKGAMMIAGLECFPAGADFEVWIAFRLPDHRKRDIDNLSKAVLDGLNKIIWDDDADISRLHLSKTVSTEPGISVRVHTI